jgi:hypothetical protein
MNYNTTPFSILWVQYCQYTPHNMKKMAVSQSYSNMHISCKSLQLYIPPSSGCHQQSAHFLLQRNITFCSCNILKCAILCSQKNQSDQKTTRQSMHKKLFLYESVMGHAAVQPVGELCYKPERCGFNSQ